MGGYGNINQIGRMIAQMLARGLESGLTGMTDAAAAKAALDARQRRMLDDITTEEARDLAKLRLRKAQAELNQKGFSGFGYEDGIAAIKKQKPNDDPAALFLTVSLAALAAAGINHITGGALERLFTHDNISGYKVDENGVVTSVRGSAPIDREKNDAIFKARRQRAGQAEERKRLKAQQDYLKKQKPNETAKPNRRRKKKGAEGQT